MVKMDRKMGKKNRRGKKTISLFYRSHEIKTFVNMLFSSPRKLSGGNGICWLGPGGNVQKKVKNPWLESIV